MRIKKKPAGHLFIERGGYSFYWTKIVQDKLRSIKKSDLLFLYKFRNIHLK
jgi:hypothetical protein